jgi:uncharacterized protein
MPAAVRRGLLLSAAAALLTLVVIAGEWLPLPPALQSWQPRLSGYVTVFLGIFIEALPFLLAGVLVSAGLHVFVSAERIQSLTPRGALSSALAGASLGLLFPVCECGSIPAARRLIRKGTSLPAAIAFALAAPVINPIVLLATYAAFNDLTIVAWRAGLTVLIAVLIGVIVGTAPQAASVLAAGVLQPDAHDQLPTGAAARFTAFVGHVRSEFFEMVRYLIFGALLAAGLQTFVPQETLIGLGSGPLISVVALSLLAALLSVCSTVDAFIALSFAGTFTPGAVLAFLVFGPMIDIKSTLMLTSTFSRRTVVSIVLLSFVFSVLAGTAINVFGG